MQEKIDFSDVENVDHEWWAFKHSKSFEVYDIEWCQLTGIIRARSDSRSRWLYRECKKAEQAFSLGMGLISRFRQGQLI